MVAHCLHIKNIYVKFSLEADQQRIKSQTICKGKLRGSYLDRPGCMTKSHCIFHSYV